MYTGSPLPDLPATLADAGKADGFILLCLQSALQFGSDRRIPVEYRPVVRIKTDATRQVVLPCTTRHAVDSAEFYALSPERVMWTRATERASGAFWRFEVVQEASAPHKIGVMTQNARVDLLKWVRSKY